MDGYQRAACWIDRFASRLQEHGVLREEAIEIAAREWDDDRPHPDPEAAAEALFGWSGTDPARRAGRDTASVPRAPWL